MTESEQLVKVHIDLTGHPETGGEAMWARDLGDDLYELRNTPFFAYDLNFMDIVYAVSAAPDLKPSIHRVERRSGHRTLWLTFADSVSPEQCLSLATELNPWYAYFESARQRYFAIDVEPEGDYAAVVSRIDEWLSKGLVRRFRFGPSNSDVREA